MAWEDLGTHRVPAVPGYTNSTVPPTFGAAFHRRDDGLVEAMALAGLADAVRLAYFAIDHEHQSGFAFIGSYDRNYPEPFDRRTQLNTHWWAYAAAVYYRDHLAVVPSLEALVRRAWAAL